MLNAFMAGHYRFTFRVVQLQVAYLYITLFPIKLYQYFGPQIRLVQIFQCLYIAHTVL